MVGAQWVLRVPSRVRRLLLRAMPYSAAAMRRYPMTVGVSAVGMFGTRASWGIPISPATAMVTVGGIARRPALTRGGEVREHVCLTVTFDHDIVDGGPAARLCERLSKLMEAAYGLQDAVMS